MLTKVEKISTFEMARRVARENRPFDYSWLRYIRRTMSDRELHNWAVIQIESFVGELCRSDVSKQFIGRAANKLIDYVFSEVW